MLAHFGVVASLVGLVALFGAFPVQVTGAAPAPQFAAERLTLPGLAAAAPAGISSDLVARAIPLTVVSAPIEADSLPEPLNSTDDAVNAIVNAQRLSASPIEPVSSSQEVRTPIYFEYEVQTGDTLIGIANRFGVTVNHIVWNNSEIVDQNSLSVGMRLQVPSVGGIIHSVRLGETVSEIARLYDAEPADIVAFRANALFDDPNRLLNGAVILVPGGRIVPPVAESIIPRPGATVSSAGWMWPVDSKHITSQFGPRHPLGIDIGVAVGQPIYAANSGTVSFVGGFACCSYGFHVIIDHGSGYESLYAHMREWTVEVGQSVQAGQVIGYVGLSGQTTGPHIHFEIRRNRQHQDPFQWLP